MKKGVKDKSDTSSWKWSMRHSDRCGFPDDAQDDLLFIRLAIGGIATLERWELRLIPLDQPSYGDFCPDMGGTRPNNTKRI
jgi:hypothetical protein